MPHAGPFCPRKVHFNLPALPGDPLFPLPHQPVIGAQMCVKPERVKINCFAALFPCVFFERKEIFLDGLLIQAELVFEDLSQRLDGFRFVFAIGYDL